MNKKIYCLWYFLIAVAVPVVISSIFLALEKGHQSLFSIMPAWNDEDFYFNQIKSILEYGQPLGYYGYDGSHAAVGNFGAHGWFILMPYVIFCRIFGLHFNSIAVVNLIMLMVAVFTYEMLFKPTIKRAVLFTTLIGSPMLVFYINTCMMEGENYFWAIMTAVLMAHLAWNNGGKKAKAALAIIIIMAILSKVTWAVLIFPFVLILLKDKEIKGIVKTAIAGGVTLVGGGTGYFIYNIFTAPYFEGTYFIDIYLGQITQQGIVSGLIYIVKQFVKNMLSTFSLYGEWWIEISKDYILVVALLALLYWILYRKKAFSYIPIFVTGGFICGILFLYGVNAPAVRNIYPAAVFAISYMMATLKTEKTKHFIYAVAAVFFAGTMLVQAGYGFDKRRWYTTENDKEYAEIVTHMSNITINERAETPWDNTLVISFSSYPDTIYELFVPAGTGINYYMVLPENMNEVQAKYILLSNKNENDLEKALAGNYTVIDEFFDVYILERTK